MFTDIKNLAKQLVAIPSVNYTEGEVKIASFIYNYLKEYPYFKEHPDYLFLSPLKDDPMGRSNVFAVLRGEKGKSKDTILFHGHIDTVGVDDYGSLKQYAFSCDALMEQLRKISLPEDVKKDLDSGDYLFGRGICDMKSGDAVFMIVFRELTKHVKEIDGNIVMMFNPVEENLHLGMISALDTLLSLKQKYGFNYLFAINNDYICPLYPGDTHKYIYSGSAGKLLPCFYIHGKETHVGQCFEGFDASLTAANIIEEVNLNPEYCDSYKGEVALPPTVLSMHDQKDFYNVQTSQDAFVYFNYFVHNKPFSEVLKQFVIAAEKALCKTASLTDKRFRRFCEISGTKYIKKAASYSVLTFEELCIKVKSRTADFTGLFDKLLEESLQKTADQRLVALNIVKGLFKSAGITNPAIVVFFAPPYCPHNTLHEESESDLRLLKKLDLLIGDFGKYTEDSFKLLRFFPSLSDSSYLKIDDDPESIKLLQNNFTAYRHLYNLPFDTIRELNIPGINYGCFGKDAHKWTERVYIPYSYNVLPKMILHTIKSFFM